MMVQQGCSVDSGRTGNVNTDYTAPPLICQYQYLLMLFFKKCKKTKKLFSFVEKDKAPTKKIPLSVVERGILLYSVAILPSDAGT